MDHRFSRHHLLYLRASFHCDGQPPTGIVELNKKRKLQYELGDSSLPWPKHKFRDRSSSSDHLSLISEIPENERNPLNQPPGRDMDDILEQPDESYGDSSNFIGVHDNTTGLDFKSKIVKSLSQTSHHDPSLTSSNSCNNNVFRDALYSLDSGSIMEANVDEAADLEDTLESMEDQNPGFGAYGDYYADSESGKNGIEFTDAASEDMMLYSNDVAPNAFLLSSGRWNHGQDARLGSRKPTIDQEFEQYFSMLML